MVTKNKNGAADCSATPEITLYSDSLSKLHYMTNPAKSKILRKLYDEEKYGKVF